MTKKSGPACIPVNGAEAAEKFRDDNEVVVVGFVVDVDCGSEVAELDFFEVVGGG